MSNPWLSIRLEDYEGHMALPDVGQAKMLVNEFSEKLVTLESGKQFSLQLFNPGAIA